MIERLKPVLQADRQDPVVVLGDVNFTLTAALATVKLGISLAHIESGVRSFYATMPEEINQ